MNPKTLRSPKFAGTHESGCSNQGYMEQSQRVLEEQRDSVKGVEQPWQTMSGSELLVIGPAHFWAQKSHFCIFLTVISQCSQQIT